MFMMFVYVDDKVHNSMGIRGDLQYLHDQAVVISRELFKKNPNAEVRTKITMYI